MLPILKKQFLPFLLIFSVLYRLTTDIQDFKSSFKQVVSQGLRSVTQAIGGGMTLYALSPKLTYLMLLVLPGIIMVLTKGKENL